MLIWTDLLRNIGSVRIPDRGSVHPNKRYHHQNSNNNNNYSTSEGEDKLKKKSNSIRMTQNDENASQNNSTSETERHQSDTLTAIESIERETLENLKKLDEISTTESCDSIRGSVVVHECWMLLCSHLLIYVRTYVHIWCIHSHFIRILSFSTLNIIRVPTTSKISSRLQSLWVHSLSTALALATKACLAAVIEKQLYL